MALGAPLTYEPHLETDPAITVVCSLTAKVLKQGTSERDDDVHFLPSIHASREFAQRMKELTDTAIVTEEVKVD
jgi:hypothetical protein